MDKDKDSEYQFFNRDKSHNSAYYKQITRVSSNTREELQNILKTTNLPLSSVQNSPSSCKPFPNLLSIPSSASYWEDPAELMSHGPDYSGSMDVLGYPTGPNISDGFPISEAFTVSEAETETVKQTVDQISQKRKKKKRKFNERIKMGNMSKYSQREIEREIARNSKKLNDKIQIENLKNTLGNPWDGVSFEDKKQFALHFYYLHLQVRLKYL